MYRKKVEFPELEKSLASLFEMHKASEVLVEDKASGQQIVQVFKRNTSLPIIPMTPGKDMALKKEERLMIVSSLFEAGKVKLPRNKEWVTTIVDELVNFPGVAHDDIVDSISQYLSRRLKRRAPRATCF